MADEKTSHQATGEYSSSSQNSGVAGAPPAPYGKVNIIPEDFRKAGIKEEDLVLLGGYNTIIVVDDSGSMVTLWEQTREAVSKLVSAASRYSVGGVDIYFLNESHTGWSIFSRFRSHNCRSSEDVDELFKGVAPYGETPLGGFFKDTIEGSLKKIRQGGSESCKFNYIFITDGRPSDDLKGPIVKIAKELNGAGATLSQFVIQFIHIGGDARTSECLKEIREIRDMVDAESFKPELTGAQLTKVILGGISRRLNAKKTDAHKIKKHI